MSLGIDIGKFKIKIVELVSTDGTIEIKQLGSIPVFEDLNKLISNIKNEMWKYYY